MVILFCCCHDSSLSLSRRVSFSVFHEQVVFMSFIPISHPVTSLHIVVQFVNCLFDWILIDLLTYVRSYGTVRNYFLSLCWSVTCETLPPADCRCVCSVLCVCCGPTRSTRDTAAGRGHRTLQEGVLCLIPLPATHTLDSGLLTAVGLCCHTCCRCCVWCVFQSPFQSPWYCCGWPSPVSLLRVSCPCTGSWGAGVEWREQASEAPCRQPHASRCPRRNLPWWCASRCHTFEWGARRRTWMERSSPSTASLTCSGE